MNTLNKLFLIVVAMLVMVDRNVSQAQTMVVTVPVANLRTGPGVAPSGVVGPALSLDSKTPGTNIQQDSQLLMNELVLVEKDNLGLAGQGWYKIQAIMQPGLVNGQWQGCSGFIQADQVKLAPYFPCINAVVKVPWAEFGTIQLSLGTCLSALPGKDDTHSFVELANGQEGLIKTSELYWLNVNVQESIATLRSSLVQVLRLFQASPYVWGGCSAYDKSNTAQLTGVDCSALIYLAMRAHGLLIPRNAHAQYIKAISLSTGADLKPGDAVYTRRTDRERIGHVHIYLGDDTFIETTALGFSSAKELENPARLTTRIISSQEFFGCSVAELCNDREFVGYSADKKVQCVMYLRTFFGSDQQVAQLRNDFCSVVNNIKINF